MAERTATPARTTDCAHCGIVISAATRAAHTNCFPEHRQPAVKAADPSRCTIVTDGERRPKPIKARDWCNGHLQRWNKHGNPTGGSDRRSSGVLLALVQNAAHATTDQCILAPCENSRPSLQYRGKPMAAARAVWTEATGEDPEHPIRFTCGQGDSGCINIRHLYLDQPDPEALCTVCSKPAEPGNPFKGTEHAAYCYQRARRNNTANPLCVTPGCGRHSRDGGTGMCDRCYQRTQRGNDPAARTFRQNNKGKVCKVGWCDAPATHLGWCVNCYAWSCRHDGTDPTARRYRYSRSVEDLVALVLTIAPDPVTGCRDTTGTFSANSGGYPTTTIKGSKRSQVVTRLVLAHKLGRPLGRAMQACHTCDNPPCAEPSHLWEGTAADNSRDRDSKGRGARGEGNGRSRLNAEKVREIRARYLIGNNQHESNVAVLAAEFGVKNQAIRDIVHGRTWAHVK